MKAASWRHAALLAIGRFRRDGAYSEDAASSAIVSAGLDARDAAACTRLVAGTLQNLALLDFYISRFCTQELSKLEPRVLDVLRVSAFQILYMDRIPARAAVSEGVELCKLCGYARASGLVNAVLRRLADSAAALPEVPGSGTAEYLSVRYSHPLWLVNELIAEHGYDFTRGFLEANNSELPITAQVNTLRISARELEKRLFDRGIEVSVGTAPDSLDLRGAGKLTDLPEFREGLFYVQDAAAKRAVLCTGVKPGASVLDACAAPGGKSFAAAISMQDTGRIVACDINPKKLSRITDGAERLGLSCISCAPMDARTPYDRFKDAFDVVIADAPCSGLGVIRKKPDIRYKDPAQLEELPQVQAAILHGLSACVKPKGTLLYSTCTVRRRENEDVVQAFAESHIGFAIEEMHTFWPHIHGTDGFFICRMIRSI